MKIGKLGALLGRGKNLSGQSGPAAKQAPAQPERATPLPSPAAPSVVESGPESEITTASSLSDTTAERNAGHTEPQEPSMDDDEHLVVINLTPAQLDQSEQKLAELIRVCPGAYGAIISTIDGHNILHSLKRDIPFNKISTMTSSLLALGESISRESEQRLCQFVILENSNGRVVSLRINDFLMLTCISTKDSNLGMLLSAGRNTADALNELLRS